jgi:hypothetical protein
MAGEIMKSNSTTKSYDTFAHIMERWIETEELPPQCRCGTFTDYGVYICKACKKKINKIISHVRTNPSKVDEDTFEKFVEEIT